MKRQSGNLIGKKAYKLSTLYICIVDHVQLALCLSGLPYATLCLPYVYNQTCMQIVVHICNSVQNKYLLNGSNSLTCPPVNSMIITLGLPA